MRKPDLIFPDQLDASEFVENYWQKKPLLMRNAIPGFESPVSAEELAGLACEEFVESRIVLEKPGPDPWELRHGPFDEKDFTGLPETHWTLLVQECNKHIHELAWLMDCFNFIPNWRVDDAMVSFAVPGGSVGPHVDQYDVFLLQAQGTRRWQINSHRYGSDDFLQNCDLRILQAFESEQQWDLLPGDVLYLPPGIAHYGVAQTECMTISIGFRAPTHFQLLSAFCDELMENCDDFSAPRYTDAGRKIQPSPGLIDDDSLTTICNIIQHYAQDTREIKKWFGRFITSAVNTDDMPLPGQDYSVDSLQAKLSDQPLYRSEWVRFAYADLEDGVYLYIDGKEFPLSESLAFAAPLLCDHRQLTKKQIEPHFENELFLQLLITIVNQGYYYFKE